MATTTKAPPKQRARKAPEDHKVAGENKVLRRIPVSPRRVELFTAVGEDEEGNEVERTVLVRLPRSGLSLATRATALIQRVGSLASTDTDAADLDPTELIAAYASLRGFVKGLLVGTDAETDELIDGLGEDELLWCIETIISEAVGTATEALPNS